MVSISAVALGISFLTTSLLTIHDTAKQVEHAKGFATFLLTQDIQSNAQYALTCVTTAIEERVITRGEEIKKNLVDASTDIFNQSLNTLQTEIEKKINSLNISSLINLVRMEETKINETSIANQQIDAEKKSVTTPNNKTQEPNFFSRISNLKNLISLQIDKELAMYQSMRREKQKQAIMYLYEIYKEGEGLKNSKWITPYNIVMMILMGVGSFFIPKIVIGLAISYFLSAEAYMLSDTIAAVTKSEVSTGLNFDHIFEFHLMVFATGLGLNRYNFYKYKEPGNKGNVNQGLSASF